ncbi:MAG: Uncharacterized oxidoreductase YqkF [uncultured Adhaeribacter sp.]|uniref:Uncharacterized oxidoreductase YqkF n=1 Tax=uncultured Adhaeribacter sp. TaxID=448109 RepID=A0A6J4JKA1_9BACT|nr:MAG: Uncharacterized oxidoreductase YqkF [uncultured Adhaeribacter sp.]
MQYHKLGKSDLQVSAVSFGCMSLTGTDRAAHIQLLHEAAAHGINFFDTADLYEKGENEKLLGEAFRHKRSEIILATKVGNQWRPDGSGWDWNPRQAYILAAVENSLKRLQTDYIDLYQLHGGTLEDPIDETIEAFELLKQQGKIREYGISSIRPNVIREYVQRSNIASVMMQYSLLDRRPEETCLDLLQQSKIGVLARGSLAQGLLASKPAKDYLTYPAAAVNQLAQTVRAVAGTNRRPAEVAVQYVLAHPAVSSAVMGIRTPEQLKDSRLVSEAKALSEVELNQLKQTLPPNTYDQHR